MTQLKVYTVSNLEGLRNLNLEKVSKIHCQESVENYVVFGEITKGDNSYSAELTEQVTYPYTKDEEADSHFVENTLKSWGCDPDKQEWHTTCTVTGESFFSRLRGGVKATRTETRIEEDGKDRGYVVFYVAADAFNSEYVCYRKQHHWFRSMGQLLEIFMNFWKNHYNIEITVEEEVEE